MLKIAIICGGPSQERGISLNSARSFLDHSSPLNLELTVLYVTPKGEYYQLTPSQLYSNTPADFDFKLSQTSTFLDEPALVVLLHRMDLVFPLIHGAYGEDGTLQAFLEAHGIPYVGSSSEVCRNTFDKHRFKQLLKLHQVPSLPFQLVTPSMDGVEDFWNAHCCLGGIIKPAASGSSIGVKYAETLKDVQELAASLLTEGFEELILEPYCDDVEFTVCVLESHQGFPVSLIPIEIDIGGKAWDILDYRKKYLPSEQTRYYCPPHFSDEKIYQIRLQAERLFVMAGLRDFVRIDGWLSKEGVIRFSDLNPISGMEQNSFIFQQSTRAGISHTDLIQYIIENALKRSHQIAPVSRNIVDESHRLPVHVLMGGSSSERHVSLMSGTNVWLKLLNSRQYKPVPYLLTEECIWRLPYSFNLHHTVEETVEHCLEAEKVIQRIYPVVQEIRQKLQLPSLSSLEAPISMNLEEFIREAKDIGAFVFIALHGGIGEDGTLQKRFEEAGIPFNGSESNTSSLCMDKHLTAVKVASLNNPEVLAIPQLSFYPALLFGNSEAVSQLWQQATAAFGTQDILIKPQAEGCSTGVVRLHSEKELSIYLQSLSLGLRQLLPGMFEHQSTVIPMPASSEGPFLLEPFIHTDRIYIHGSELHHEARTGWCEMTVAVIEKNGHYTSLAPSITVAENHVLSVEEKFQGGTGINITPPPEHIFSSTALKQMKENICLAAKTLGIKNYARLDVFTELSTGKILLIEVNTLPALTPSTVFYHQALNETPPLSPLSLLTQIIDNAQK